jgi:hypothetical protein
MVRFVLELRQRPWAAELAFDLSMLRLWIARNPRTGKPVTIITPRVSGRGISVAKDDVAGSDFLRIDVPGVTGAGVFVCTDKAREAIEGRASTNVVFVEVDDIL